MSEAGARRVSGLTFDYIGGGAAPAVSLVVIFEDGGRAGIDAAIEAGQKNISAAELVGMLAGLAQFLTRDRGPPDVPKRDAPRAEPGTINASDPEWLAKIRKGIG